MPDRRRPPMDALRKVAARRCDLPPAPAPSLVGESAALYRMYGLRPDVLLCRARVRPQQLARSHEAKRAAERRRREELRRERPTSRRSVSAALARRHGPPLKLQVAAVARHPRQRAGGYRGLRRDLAD